MIFSNALTLVLFCTAVAAGGVRDPAFEKIPFEQWLTSADTTPLKWTISVPTPQLDPCQRLLAHLEIKFDGAGLEPLGGKGELRVFVQIEDSAGERYQDHGQIDLEHLKPGFRKYDLTYSQPFFVTPGQYRFSVLVVHSTTGDRWTRRLTVSVAPLKADPIPGIWKDMPPIELIPPSEPPDSYYLPTLKGRLSPLSQFAAPLEVDILVNLSSSAREAGMLHIQQRNLGFLIPAMKALTQLLPAGTKINIDLLDLVRQTVAFHQPAGSPIDFEKMRSGLLTEPGKIDLRSLAQHKSQSSYFVSEVAKHLAPSRVLIILSARMELDAGEAPAHLDAALPPGAQVYYFCYAPPRARERIPLGREGLARERRPRFIEPPPVDRLAPALKALRPTLYIVETPQQLRKSLAALLLQVATPER